MLQVYDEDSLAAAAPDEIGDALEKGNIIKFMPCPIELPGNDALETLRTELPRQLKRKNVSYHPEADKVTGLDDDSRIKDLAYDVLSAHRNRITAFLRKVMPTLASNIKAGTCSFRPLEEQGRNLKPHASNELVHVDAGAYGATNGDRILRFFVNVNPEKDRVWASKGAFPDLFEKYGRDAGLYESLTPTLERGPLGKMRTSLLNGLAHIGLPLATVLDSSPYDRVMRKFHNYMKDTPEFQARMDDHQMFRFEPFSAWMVLTDMVSHASCSGQHALVYTGLVRLEDCRLPELAPFNILRAAA
ncbi:MAG: Kdo hydroxylase family protein [Gammaproteobacteria bacterium]|nr:Kdo hydroxylase family protein [Gammaproteobacteria bacterium]